MPPQKIPNPHIENYIWACFKDELRALKLFIRYQWYVILISMVGVSFLIDQLNPFPPSTIKLATGQPNSTLEVLGGKFQAYFKTHGVDVVLVPSKGAADSLALLNAGKVDVALSQGGLDVPADSGVLSLGSIGYQPLWLFYTGQEFTGDDVFAFLRNKRVYTGVPGSGTRMMVDALLNELGPMQKREFLAEDSVAAREAVAALLTGKLDALFLVGGFESGNIQALLKSPQVRLMNFPVGHALARRMDYVEVVSVPRGAVMLSPPSPRSDINMIATTTTLLIQKDLHQAIQILLLGASKDLYGQEPYFFDRPGGFPVFIDKKTPRSPVAQKFYTRGPPFLSAHLPYWLASFVDLVWFSFLTVIAIIYPLLRLFPGHRKYVFLVLSSRLYGEIFELEKQLYAAGSEQALRDLRVRIVQMDEKVRQVWSPRGTKESLTLVVNALEMLVKRANNRFKNFNIPLLD